MGDMGDLWVGHREAVQKHRAQKLAEADTTGWTPHSPYHFSRLVDGVRIEWWPSGGKAKFGPRMVYGHAKVRREFERLGLATKGGSAA